MAAELPHDLAVANRCRIEGIEQGPVEQGCAAACHGIEMPVDRITKGQLAISEQIEPLLERVVRRRDNSRATVRASLTEDRGHSGIASPGEEAAGHLLQALRDNIGRDSASQTLTGLGLAIEPLRELLPGAAGELGKAHADGAPELHRVVNSTPRAAAEEGAARRRRPGSPARSRAARGSGPAGHGASGPARPLRGARPAPA